MSAALKVPKNTMASIILQWKKFDQIQCYFTVNKLKTDLQHSYREEHSTSTPLTQMTDDWLREHHLHK
jgi:hypothetical protein